LHFQRKLPLKKEPEFGNGNFILITIVPLLAQQPVDMRTNCIKRCTGKARFFINYDKMSSHRSEMSLKKEIFKPFVGFFAHTRINLRYYLIIKYTVESCSQYRSSRFEWA